MFLHPPAKTFAHDKFRLIMTRTIAPRDNNVKKVFVELLIDRRMVLNHTEEGFNFTEKVLGVTRVTGVFVLFKGSQGTRDLLLKGISSLSFFIR